MGGGNYLPPAIKVITVFPSSVLLLSGDQEDYDYHSFYGS